MKILRTMLRFIENLVDITAGVIKKLFFGVVLLILVTFALSAATVLLIAEILN